MVPTLQKPNTVLFVLLFMPFIKPVGLDSFGFINTLFVVWKLAVLVYLFLTLVPKCFGAKLWKNNLSMLGISVFWCIFLFNCLRSGTDVILIATAALSCILFLLLIAYELKKGNGVILLRAMARLFTVYIIAHILSVLLSIVGLLQLGDGSSTVYLFGMDNYSAFFLYPMLIVVLFYCGLRYGRLTWRGWLLLLSVVFTYLLTASATAAGAGLLMLGLYLVQPLYRKLPQFFGVRWIVPTLIVFLILICGFQAQNLLASLLDSMSKGVTLNSRTIIWDLTLDLFVQKPLLGHGNLTQEQIDAYVLYGTTHAHNFLLELLLRTGIVGTVGYLMFLCGFIPFGIRRRNKAADKYRNILLVGLVSQLLVSFMDFYPTITVFYLFMGVLYFWKSFAKQFRPHLFAPQTNNTAPQEEL